MEPDTPRIWTRAEVRAEVGQIITESLAVDAAEVTDDASLIRDLGAESIDYLDITFQLEKVFSIKIPKGELIPENLFSNPEFVNNGKVTAKGIA